MSIHTSAKSSKFIPARVDAGVPSGGQFKDMEKSVASEAVTAKFSEASLRLTSGDRQTFTERAEILAGNGFVPATTIGAAAAPSTTAGIGEWYQRAAVVAERRDDGKAYADIGRGEGANRMRYQGGGVDLRMMSKASILRTSARHRNASVDVPVAVSVDGKAPVQANVRVTQIGKDKWKVTALGGDGTTDEEKKLEEAVTAVLESRRVTGSIARAGDLLEARRAREAAEGAKIAPIGTSQFINGMGFDAATQTIGTEINGKYYGHAGSADLFKRVMDSDRKGALFNQLVKKGESREVQNCGTCGRFSVAGVQHTCPSEHKEAELADPTRLGIERNYAARIARARGNAEAKSTPPAPSPEAAQPVNAYASKPIPQVEARNRMAELRSLPDNAEVLVDGQPMFKIPYEGEKFGHPDNKSMLKVGYGAGRFNREISVNAMRDGYVDVRPRPAASTPAEASHLMQQAKLLEPGDKVIIDSYEMYAHSAPEDGSVHFSAVPGGPAVRELDTDLVGRGVRFSIPREVTDKRIGKMPEPIAPINTKENYLKVCKDLQSSAAALGFRFAVGLDGQPGLRSGSLSTKMDDEGQMAASRIGPWVEEDMAPAEAMHKWTVANGQALREVAAATRRRSGWRVDAHEALKPAVQPVQPSATRTSQPAPATTKPVPVKRETKPRPAHLEKPIMSPTDFARELVPLKTRARRAGFEITSNGVQKVCESSCSTDSYFAQIRVDENGQLHRAVNNRPVPAFEDKHAKAKQLEAWTAKEALAMARITDAEQRRSMPAGQSVRPVAQPA